MFAPSQRELSAYANVQAETGVAAASPHGLILMLFDGAQVASDIRFALLKAFAENGIAIAHAPSQPEQKS